MTTDDKAIINSGDKSIVNSTTEQAITDTTSVTSKNPATLQRKLTRKQKAFADYLIEHPKASASEAVRQSYSVSKPDSNAVAQIATENLRKPQIQAYMALHGDMASNAILRVMSNSEKLAIKTGSVGHAGIVLTAGNSILDRLHGKATVKTENTSVTVNIQTALD